MKPINEMSWKECLDLLRKKRMPIVMADGEVFHGMFDHQDRIEIADRIEELTRWIPVEERMPTEEDADENGEIYIWSVDGSAYIILLMHALDEQDDYHIGFTHWRRIDKPEGV